MPTQVTGKSSAYWNRLTDADDDYVKPLKQRTLTDRAFIIIQFVCYLSLIVSLIYSACNGDRMRTWGYDNCGNVCGEDNHFSIINKQFCSPEDMIDKPYLDLTSLIDRQCVRECNASNLLLFNYLCIPIQTGNNDLSYGYDLTKLLIELDLWHSAGAIAFGCAASLGLAIGFALLFRIAAGLIVWLSLIGMVALFAFSSGLLFVEAQLPLAGIILAVITLILAVLIYVTRTKIQLVIQLFYEAGKVVLSIPILLLQPIVTLVAAVVLVIVFGQFDEIASSSGFAVEANGRVTFEQNTLMSYTYWFNWLMGLWSLLGLFSCHHMIISGATALWFFSRDKSNLGYPYLRSVHTTFRYHVGTLSLGSFLILCTYIIKMLIDRIKKMIKYTCGFCCCGCCFAVGGASPLLRILEYLTFNTYTITAIHGTPFWSSGSKLFHLLSENLLSVVTLNVIGSIVFAIGRLFAISCSILLTYMIIRENAFYVSIAFPLVVVGFVALLVSYAFMELYHVIVDAIFVCFCEDCKENDGTTRPYYMSQSLNDVVQKSETILGNSGHNLPQLPHVNGQNVA